MTNNEMMTVAETIRSQIHPTVLMCAAARIMVLLKTKTVYMVFNLKLVMTSKYKFATVRIILNGCDLYDIEIKNIRGRIVDSKTDIYCDQLAIF